MPSSQLSQGNEESYIFRLSPIQRRSPKQHALLAPRRIPILTIKALQAFNSVYISMPSSFLRSTEPFRNSPTRRKWTNNLIPLLKMLHFGPDLLHNPRKLVAHNKPSIALLMAPEDMQLATAERRINHFDDDVCLVDDLGDRALFDRDFVWAMEDDGFHGGFLGGGHFCCCLFGLGFLISLKLLFFCLSRCCRSCTQRSFYYFPKI